MHDTHDIVHDVVAQSLRRLDEFQPEREGALQAYLRRAVLNRINDEYRRAARRPRQEELGEEAAEARDPSPLEATSW